MRFVQILTNVIVEKGKKQLFTNWITVFLQLAKQIKRNKLFKNVYVGFCKSGFLSFNFLESFLIFDSKYNDN